MMRLKTGIFLTIAAFAQANAHTAGGDESIPYELWHQLFGVHHLPVTILLAVGAIMLFRRLWKSPERSETRMR